MRHGSTVWNEVGITQGRSHNRLSKLGKQQAEDKAKEYSKIKFDVIYCSPLMRTVQTANIMNKYHNVKIIKTDHLIEIDQGVFTGRRKQDLTELEKQQKSAKLESLGMETWANAYVRASAFVEELINTCTYDDVLIVTHDYIATCVENAILGKKVDYVNYKYFRDYKNAEIRKFVVTKR